MTTLSARLRDPHRRKRLLYRVAGHVVWFTILLSAGLLTLWVFLTFSTPYKDFLK